MFFKQGLNFFSLSISFFKISNTFWLTMGCPMILNKMPTRWTWGLCRWVLNQCLCQCRDGPCLHFAQKRSESDPGRNGLQRNEVGYYHKSYIHIISLVLLFLILLSWSKSYVYNGKYFLGTTIQGSYTSEFYRTKHDWQSMWIRQFYRLKLLPSLELRPQDLSSTSNRQAKYALREFLHQSSSSTLGYPIL